jgi:hypothetical protein
MAPFDDDWRWTCTPGPLTLAEANAQYRAFLVQLRARFQQGHMSRVAAERLASGEWARLRARVETARDILPESSLDGV